MHKLLLSCVSSLGAFFLYGCGSALTGPTQTITLETPGAENVECSLHNRDFKYRMRTGETRKIMRSEYDLIVDCAAPGNRNKSVVFDNRISSAGKGNLFNAGLGIAYDYIDNSLYEYPSVISVSFMEINPQPYDNPDHMAPDLPDHKLVPVENMGPTTPATPGDQFSIPTVIQKKERAVYNDTFGPTVSAEPTISTQDDMSSDMPTSLSVSPASAPPKPLPPVDPSKMGAPNASSVEIYLYMPPVENEVPQPGMSVEELTRSMNPQVFQAQ